MLMPLQLLGYGKPLPFTLLKFEWYLTNNKVEFEKEGYASIWPLIDVKIAKFWFPLNNLTLNEWISLKIIWYMSQEFKVKLLRGNQILQLNPYFIDGHDVSPRQF